MDGSEDDRIQRLLDRLGVPPDSPLLDEARTLVGHLALLGAPDDEIVHAGRHGQLGPLALDLVLRPPGETLTFDEFVERSSFDADFLRQLWQALGLPERGALRVPVTPDLAEALGILAFVAVSVGDDAVLGLARVIGSSTARIAEALANAIRVSFEVPQLDAGARYSDVMDQMQAAAKELLPVLWDAAGAVFRRHLVLVSSEKWAADDARRAVTIERTVGFVDLVGSTEVLRTMSVPELVAAIDRFERLVWDVVSAGGGRVLKLIGDEAMFLADDPVAGCRIARALLDEAGSRVRVGLAHGELVAYHGDCYGPTVNLAARLVAVAAPGAALVAEAVAVAAADEITLDAAPTGPLPGFPEVTTAYRLG